MTAGNRWSLAAWAAGLGLGVWICAAGPTPAADQAKTEDKEAAAGETKDEAAGKGKRGGLLGFVAEENKKSDAADGAKPEEKPTEGEAAKKTEPEKPPELPAAGAPKAKSGGLLGFVGEEGQKSDEQKAKEETDKTAGAKPAAEAGQKPEAAKAVPPAGDAKNPPKPGEEPAKAGEKAGEKPGEKPVEKGGEKPGEKGDKKPAEPALPTVSVTLKEDQLQTLKLKISELAEPRFTLSNGDLYEVDPQRGPRSPIQIDEGTVLTKNNVIFTKGAANNPAVLSVAGESLTATYDGKFNLTVGRKVIELKRQGAGLETVRLPTAGKGKYNLAFPYIKEEKDKEITFRSHLTFYYRSGEEAKGKLDGKAISFYDDNLDGRLTLAEDTFSYDEAPVFAPVTALVGTKRGVYQLRDLTDDARAVSAVPVADETGEVDFGWSGKSVELWTAFVSAASGCTIFPAAKGTTEAIPGDYKLLYGLVYDSKLKRVVAGILPGEKTQALTVKAGEKTKYRFGPPFQIYFELDFKGENFTIALDSLRLIGAAGEEYASLTVLDAPRVSLIVDGKARAWGEFSSTKGVIGGFKGEPPVDKNRDPLKGKQKLVISARFAGFGPVEAEREISF